MTTPTPPPLAGWYPPQPPQPAERRFTIHQDPQRYRDGRAWAGPPPARWSRLPLWAWLAGAAAILAVVITIVVAATGHSQTWHRCVADLKQMNVDYGYDYDANEAAIEHICDQVRE